MDAIPTVVNIAVVVIQNFIAHIDAREHRNYHSYSCVAYTHAFSDVKERLG